MNIPVELATAYESNGALFFKLYAGAQQAIASLPPGTTFVIQPYPYKDPENPMQAYGMLLVDKEPESRRVRVGTG